LFVYSAPPKEIVLRKLSKEEEDKLESIYKQELSGKFKQKK